MKKFEDYASEVLKLAAMLLPEIIPCRLLPLEHGFLAQGTRWSAVSGTKWNGGDPNFLAVEARVVNEADGSYERVFVEGLSAKEAVEFLNEQGCLIRESYE